jgi:HEPN domain-containing protein|tara:strand:+ start:6087 stop:7049 length:963 start_codon:yes stop_codon:yes gene_type:complete
MTDQIEEQDVELNENEEIVDEAHDPKNAETQSVAATDKAADATKAAPKRKGDKDAKDEPAPLGNSAKPKMKDAGAQPKEDYDFSDDLEALVSEEATLSEGFKDKAAVIFEAAINSKVEKTVERLEEQYAQELEEEISKTKEDLVEKVDNYLNYVVENWMEENKLAIQSGLRAEIAEGFMNSLKDLFTESYIEVPESKVDLVDDLATEVQELEEKLNKEVQSGIDMKESLTKLQCKDALREASKDLAETQAAKLEELAESITFESTEDFAAKLATLKESYFKAEAVESVVSEETEDDSEADAVEVNEAMSQYLTAIRKTSK